MALALMNLLPIPALDGGHAIFLLIEMVKGKPLGDKFMERAQMVGFVILITLMVFVFGNDIFKHIINWEWRVESGELTVDSWIGY